MSVCPLAKGQWDIRGFMLKPHTKTHKTGSMEHVLIKFFYCQYFSISGISPNLWPAFLANLHCSCHLPVLYIGLEYGLTNNAKLAERFFTQALEIAPEDPFVLHEMGVVAFQNQEWVAGLSITTVRYIIFIATHFPVLNGTFECCQTLCTDAFTCIWFKDIANGHSTSLIMDWFWRV